MVMVFLQISTADVILWRWLFEAVVCPRQNKWNQNNAKQRHFYLGCPCILWPYGDLWLRSQPQIHPAEVTAGTDCHMTGVTRKSPLDRLSWRRPMEDTGSSLQQVAIALYSFLSFCYDWIQKSEKRENNISPEFHWFDLFWFLSLVDLLTSSYHLTLTSQRPCCINPVCVTV